MNRKGVELSVNTMIIIVIALLVLIILAFLIIGSTGKTNEQTGCDARGGHCRENVAACNADNMVPSPFSCKNDPGRKTCCMPLGS